MKQALQGGCLLRVQTQPLHYFGEPGTHPITGRDPEVIAGNTRSKLKTAWFFAVLRYPVSAPMRVVVAREIERNPWW